MIRMIAAAIVALAVLFTPTAATLQADATSLSSLQQKQADLKKQQSAADAKLKQLKNDKTKKTAYKAALEAKITNLEEQISNEQSQIDMLDNDIREKQSQIAGKQKEVDEDFAKLKDRVRALYLTGEASNLEIILNAKSIMDLADKSELLQVIAEHDTKLMDGLKSDIASIKEQKDAINSDRAAVVAKKTDLESNRRELKSQSTEITRVIAEINGEQKQTEEEKARIAAERKKTDAAIDKWFADYYAAHRNNSSGGYKGTGNFTWPVPSCFSLSSSYGRRWGGSEFHKGVDISGSGIYGAKVIAADGGKVVEAVSGYGVGYLGCRDGGGYGNHVYIDHGNGYYTVYGHLSRVTVSYGQTVKKGQQIGNVGSSGSSTGAHLHFEIRKNGSTVNPMNYFSR
jgi:murein DD-endopeptidase MepM/ murein hydrolase activator NlpD